MTSHRVTKPTACHALKQGCYSNRQSVSQGRICFHDCACCHTETEVSDPACYLPLSQCTDAGPTSPSADPITPGVWRLPCQAPGVIGPVPGLVGPVSVYCGGDSKLDLQLLSQCGSTYNCLIRSAPEMQFTCCLDIYMLYYSVLF